MNSRNVKGIKVQTPNTELIYEVTFFRRINDLRSPGFYGDRRKVGNNIGDGWNDEHNQRDILNEHVDDFISSLERQNIKHTILFEKDLQEM